MRMPRGKLYLVGIGPGDPVHATLYARSVLNTVDTIVGYQRYVELVKPWIPSSIELISMGMGMERHRALAALERASRGARVALISSGDPGVYGLASLAIAANRLYGYNVDIKVVPGVTAALAAASLLGAPLNNDFAVISLSDYLVPLLEIEENLRAVASTSMVIALYNPSSSRRRTNLVRALDMIRRARGNVPVGIVSNAYRENQRVLITRISEVDTESIGMDTLLIIGSRRTKIVGNHMITVRGYREELEV